jgi:hypothetical protein
MSIGVEEPTNDQIGEFLLHAMMYIQYRRPYEQVTLAILAETAYNFLDAAEAERRNRKIN